MDARASEIPNRLLAHLFNSYFTQTKKKTIELPISALLFREYTADCLIMLITFPYRYVFMGTLGMIADIIEYTPGEWKF